MILRICIFYSDRNSLVVVKLVNLRYLGLTSLKKINNGNVAILWNENLCYTKELNLSGIFAHSNQRKMHSKNMNADQCG